MIRNVKMRGQVDSGAVRPTRPGRYKERENKERSKEAACGGVEYKWSAGRWRGTRAATTCARRCATARRAPCWCTSCRGAAASCPSAAPRGWCSARSSTPRARCSSSPSVPLPFLCLARALAPSRPYPAEGSITYRSLILASKHIFYTKK